MDYQLSQCAIQKTGTNQCWWISMLEILRLSGALAPLFADGGRLALAIPVENGTTVYGPNWQKVLMSYVAENGWAYKPGDTVMTSQRKDELLRLANSILGLTVTIGAPVYLIPSNTRTRVAALKAGDYVQLDKTRHAMAGTVAGAADDRSILVYNQQSGSELSYTVKHNKLSTPSGKTVINFWLPISP